MNDQQRIEAINKINAAMEECAQHVNAELIPGVARVAAQIGAMMDCLAALADIRLPRFNRRMRKAVAHMQRRFLAAYLKAKPPYHIVRKHRHGERSPHKRRSA